MSKQRTKPFSKDTGIIPELGITEEMRDQLRKHDWTKPRPQDASNPDTWTTRECQEKRFSGYRKNDITMMFELWILGRIAVEKPLLKVASNPQLIAEMHEEAFATIGSIAAIDIKHKHLNAPQLGIRNGKRK